LDNDFYGATSSWTYENGDQRVQLGGGVHRYEGAHFGRVIWANNPNVSTLDEITIRVMPLKTMRMYMLNTALTKTTFWSMQMHNTAS
jgi:iron complex outermembrane receptor protein